VDLDLSATELAVVAACRQLLARNAGPARAKELVSAGKTDRALASALQEAGYVDVFWAADGGPSIAGLVTETVAEHAGLIPVGARALVAPAVCADGSLPLLTTVADSADTSIVRFGAGADALLLLDGDEARLLAPGDWDATPVESKYGYPVARVEVSRRGVGLGPGSAAVARRWWMVALASEIAGTGQAAIDITTRYLNEREQFGKPLGANQALAHRLVECAVQVIGVRWLARQAAALGAPAQASAAAALAAVKAARLISAETHQLTGAMGFTVEYDLHVWSLRLQALRVEAGGVAAHAATLFDARWPS
jgi:alkylation response protein AidB-like acyl-CoA dehydrogenase